MNFMLITTLNKLMTTVVKSIGSLLPPKRFYTIRKVKFALQPIIIFIEDDGEDRKGPWKLFAVDRDRFNRRIANVEKEIGWCFKPEHREKVFRKFFKSINF